MSKDIIHQLFRNLEVSIHERLRVIEDLMLTSVTIEKPRNETLEVTVENHERSVLISDTTEDRISSLASQIEELTKRLDLMTGKDRAPNTILLSSTLVPDEPEEEEQVNPEIEAAEAEEEEEAEAQEEEEAQEAQEDSDLDLVELDYKGTTYYRDTTTNKIYLPDDEGAIDPEAPLAIWNPQTKKIQRLS
jgi:hypothetical protein